MLMVSQWRAMTRQAGHARLTSAVSGTLVSYVWMAGLGGLWI